MVPAGPWSLISGQPPGAGEGSLSCWLEVGHSTSAVLWSPSSQCASPVAVGEVLSPGVVPGGEAGFGGGSRRGEWPLS